MATFLFNAWKIGIQDGTINMATNTIKAMLVMTNYLHDGVADPDGDKDEANLAGMTLDEFNGSGYTAGGYTLASKTFTQLANNYGVFDADDVAAGALGAGTRAITGILIYKSTGVATTDIPLSFHDITDYTANGATVTIQWSGNGIHRIT